MIIAVLSIREINFEYIKPLLNAHCKVIVVDDTDEERIKPNAPNIQVLHYSDRKKLLGELEYCIPQKNGVCRDLGLLYAYLEGEKDVLVICLDDDCEVFDDYNEKAVNSLGQKELPLVETSQRFYNPLDLYQLDMDIYPRGFPYEERGRTKDYSYT